jgi:hypothetical protein
MSIETKFVADGVGTFHLTSLPIAHARPAVKKRKAQSDVRRSLKPYINCIVKITSQSHSNVLLGLVHDRPSGFIYIVKSAWIKNER